MGTLSGRRVLLVEDDEDGRDLLCEGLAYHGAEVKGAASGEAALEVIQAWTPDIMISDLNLPEMNGFVLLARIREAPGLGMLPGIALTGHGGQAHRDAAFAAGFAKHLLKPARISDLIVAICALPAPAATVAVRDVRAILAEVNQASPCRFTSLLRFGDNDRLISMWTYDRENPTIDPYPLGTTVPASYCALVRNAGATLVIENARTDPRTLAHPKRDEQSTYLGVPLFLPDGTMFGTVCSFDPRPLSLSPSVRETIEAVTRELETLISALSPS